VDVGDPVTERVVRLDDEAPAWRPRPAPSPAELLATSFAEQATKPLALGRAAARAVRDPRPAVQATRNVVRTVRDFLAKPQPAPWNVRVGAQRRWVSATVPMTSVRRVRSRHDVTINDVVLAACAGALRSFLGDHGQAQRTNGSGEPLKAMVPVSLRSDDERGDTLGNRISLILVDLPVGLDDPLERLDAVHTQTTELKGSSSTVDGAQTILELADAVPQIARPVTSFVSRQIPMNLVVTNVPGPPVPLWFRGARLQATFPYVEVIDNEGLTIAVVSYDDHLFFGITADRDVIADVADLADGIEREFRRLARAR
ncbi:MAG: WS/DGAT domain-containing protein, partial [Actinomycetota bacterium]